MLNYWATSPEDMKRFGSWCYDVPQEVIEAHFNQLLKDTASIK
jgi:hypothetical protein